MQRKSKKSGSILKQVLIVGVIVVVIALIFKSVLGTEQKGFNIAAKNFLGKPGQRTDKDTDQAGHTEDFWTSGKFKW